MAIVCVLSVFNGFREVVSSRASRIATDMLVSPSETSLITNADSLATVIAAMPEVDIASPVISDNAVAYRDQMQLPVRLLGVKSAEFTKATEIVNTIYPGGRFPGSSPQNETMPAEDADMEDADMNVEAAPGEFDDSSLFVTQGVDADTTEAVIEEPTQQALLSNGAALQLGIQDPKNPISFGSQEVVLFMPRRTATSISATSAASSFMTESLTITGVAETEQNDFDANTIIIDLDCARRLLEYDTQASAVIVKFKNGKSVSSEDMQKRLGSGYTAKDRLEQQTLHLKMISIEKWITFMLLSFILMIASFNVVSTMSMLIIDKQKDIITLSRLGASESMIGGIFCWESAFVCSAGTLTGVILGVTLCLLQQWFGFVTISGDTSNMIVDAYPVKVQVSDMILVVLPSLLIAASTAIISSRFARRQLK